MQICCSYGIASNPQGSCILQNQKLGLRPTSWKIAELIMVGAWWCWTTVLHCMQAHSCSWYHFCQVSRMIDQNRLQVWEIWLLTQAMVIKSFKWFHMHRNYDHANSAVLEADFASRVKYLPWLAFVCAHRHRGGVLHFLQCMGRRLELCAARNDKILWASTLVLLTLYWHFLPMQCKHTNQDSRCGGRQGCWSHLLGGGGSNDCLSI